MRALQMDDAAERQPNHLTTLEQLLAIQATALKPALDAASTLIATALAADKVDVFLYDPAIDTLVAMGTSKTPMGQREIALGLDRLPLTNGGRSVEVFQRGQIYHHGQVDTDPQELRGIREGLGVRSIVAVPLTVAGVRRGVVQIDSAQRDAFSEADAHFLQAVSHWVSLVIQRAERVEQLTHEAREEARRLAAEELVTVLAHDLRNLLQPLLGRADLLRTYAEREGGERVVRHASLLYQDVQRLQRLINDLLDVGRIEQGVFTVVGQPVDLADLVRAIAATFQSQDFTLAVHAPEELVVTADLDRLRQVVENLLANARRHAPDSPVQLSVDREQRGDTLWAVVRVQDQGPGIAPEVLPRLMERFVRGHGSNGLGLGLYLARSIAEAHGGRLEVTSTLNVGTTFHVLLPMCAS
jgi:signal transduction histidine kinase